MTTAAALDSGVVQPNSTFYNAGCVQVVDANICNVEREVDGQQMSITQILEYSLNTGAVWELKQMGGGEINDSAKNTLYNYFSDHYRLDKLTGIEQSAEAEGTINKPTDAEGGPVNYANMTFGQGFQTTMVEMASAFSAVINGGTYYQAHIVDGTLDSNNILVKQDPKVIARGVVKPETSSELMQLMYDARQGYTSGAADSGHYVGSKSGTAQVYDPSTGQYSATQFIGTYLGFVADASHTPKYVIMVRVDDSQAGGFAGTTAAAPIFTNMSN
jgi:cell division protein FtsI/penicillin-binding protein 2